MSGIGPVMGEIPNLRDVLGLHSHFRNAAISLPGTVGGWQLGESAGTVARDEFRTAHGIYAATPTLAATGGLIGQPNTGVTFNGSTQWVDVAGYADVGGDITLMCLINTAYAGTAGVAMGIRNAGATANTLYLGVISTKVQFSDGLSVSAGGSTGGLPAVNDSAWHLLAGTVDNLTLRCYVDGVVSTTTGTMLATRSAITSPSLAIGAFGNNHAFPLSATIMQAYVVRRALSAAELLTLWKIARAL